MTRMRSTADLGAAIRAHRRAALLINTQSRRGRRFYRRILAGLQAAGIHLLGTFSVSHPSELPDRMTAALDLQPDLMVVGGGDGTISAAVPYLAYRDVALGLIPLGTTNNFARTLTVPRTVTNAIGLLTAGKVAEIDLGRCADVFFVNLVSVGLSGQVAAHVPHCLKSGLGRGAYLLTALTQLPRHQPFDATIITGEHTYFVRTHQLNIANGAFHGGRPITADASADDQLLLVYQLGGPTRRAMITATLRHVLLGARRTRMEPAFLAVSDLTLHTDPRLPLDIDGEIRGHAPARITIAPGALRVIVPPDYPTPDPSIC